MNHEETTPTKNLHGHAGRYLQGKRLADWCVV